MEKKELKKLGLNKKATDLTNLEASQIRGGGYWDPDFGWCADEVTVYGVDMSSVGEITGEEWDLIIMAATAGGRAGKTFGGWGAAIGAAVGGGLATWSALTH